MKAALQLMETACIYKSVRLSTLSHTFQKHNSFRFLMAYTTSLIPSVFPKPESMGINGQEDTRTPTFEQNAALKLQKMYRGHRTRRRLADTAIVVEELWWGVIDYVRLNHSTISFFDFAKPETVASRWNRVSLNASKVGKGLSQEAKALILAFQHWIEAIDPIHRYGHNLHFYYDEWRSTDSGQPFFYWMDIGDGKEVELKECPRSKLRQQCIKYLGPQERENYEYIILGGKIVHKQTAEFLDAFEKEKGTKWIYVMSTSKRLYIGKKKKGLFHHSSFLAGGATLAAGRIVCVRGELKSISAHSGHYRPSAENLGSFLAMLEENGVILDKVEVHYCDDSQNFEDSMSIKEENEGGVVKHHEISTLDIPRKMLDYSLSEQPEVVHNQSNKQYPRSLSGGLQSRKAQVPKNEILHRMNSKKVAKSIQLGHQLSLKWSTGAGPRIGCVADYPMELRLKALEFVCLSPRTTPRQPSFPQFTEITTSTPHPTIDTVVVG